MARFAGYRVYYTLKCEAKKKSEDNMFFFFLFFTPILIVAKLTTKQRRYVGFIVVDFRITLSTTRNENTTNIITSLPWIPFRMIFFIIMILSSLSIHNIMAKLPCTFPTFHLQQWSTHGIIGSFFCTLRTLFFFFYRIDLYQVIHIVCVYLKNDVLHFNCKSLIAVVINNRTL